MDHANANSLIRNGHSGEEELLVVSDLAMGYLGAYQVGSKSAARVLIALSSFLGHYRPKEFYTDRAPEFVSAMRDFLGGSLCSQDQHSRRPTDERNSGVTRQASDARYQDLALAGRASARVVTLRGTVLCHVAQRDTR